MAAKCFVCSSKDYLAMHSQFINGKKPLRSFWVCIPCHKRIHAKPPTVDLTKEVKKKEAWSVS